MTLALFIIADRGSYSITTDLLIFIIQALKDLISIYFEIILADVTIDLS